MHSLESRSMVSLARDGLVQVLTGWRSYLISAGLGPTFEEKLIT